MILGAITLTDTGVIKFEAVLLGLIFWAFNSKSEK